MTDDEIIYKVLEPQNLNFEFDDSFNDAYDNDKVLFDEGLAFVKQIL